jgi:hypothetical protein
MATDTDRATEASRRAVRAALDRLVPPVDLLPGAGSLGVLDEVERMAPHPRYDQPLLRFSKALSPAGSDGGFPTLTGEAQDAALRQIEVALPGDFALVLELVYFAYYGRPEVHHRIGWRTGPLQPLGFELPPFDEAVLEPVMGRPPLWRPAPE